MKIKNFLLAALIIIPFLTHATNSLRIIDPQWSWWYNYSPAIKKADLVIKPVGGFIENELIMEIGLLEPFEKDGLQLEIIMEFNLPANSMIIDSWLWIGDEPKQAEILDRWTASTIYEEIVNRRKDPSLLVKNSANQYTISIYPLKPNETRKFKIKYLTPMEYSGNSLLCYYPFPILQTSSAQISHLTVYAIPSNVYTNPSVKYAETDFTLVNDTELGACYKVAIPYRNFGKAQITFNDEKASSVKVFKYDTGGEGYYQLSFIPSSVLAIESLSEKICYLIDYDENFLSTSKNELLAILKSNLTGNYSMKDSFNVIFSNLTMNNVFENWVPITPQNIERVFNDFTLSNYSNLIQLLVKGITYINNSGGKGKIVLLSNSAVFQGIDNSNSILQDINRLNQNNIPINVINYMDNYYNLYWAGNSYYYGNSYLFSNIARTNSGEYISFYERMYGNSFLELLSSALKSVSDQAIKNVDVFTDLADGYCFGRTNYTSSSFQGFKMNAPVNQIGRFNGNFPMSVELSAELNSEIVHKEITIDAGDVLPVDSILKTAWTGFDISQLETENPTSQIINEVIFESMENRILSLYTAFLCLEDTIPTCEDCGENGGDIITSDTDIRKLTFKAYPNPFTTYVELTFEESARLKSIEIYNVTGQKVKEIVAEEGCRIYSWDCTDESSSLVKPGIYLVVARYDDRVETLKIQKL